MNFSKLVQPNGNSQQQTSTGPSMTQITTTSGKQYTLDQNTTDWIKTRYKADQAGTYGYDDADQQARRSGQLSAKWRSTYGNSNVDTQLAQMGLPSEKNLEKYIAQYDQWHTGTVDQVYKDVPKQQWTKMSEFWKNDYKYEDTTEDQMRKLNGQMPKALESKYTDTELDESLMMRGLPPDSELAKYAERYGNYMGINTFYANAAGRWTELRMNNELDEGHNYLKNDDTVYTVNGEKVTGRYLFTDAFYDELLRTDENGNYVYASILPLFKNNHVYSAEEKSTEDHNVYRGKEVVALGKGENMSDDFENFSAFSFDDFDSKYGDYFSKYYADTQAINFDGTLATYEDGSPVTIADALSAFDKIQTEKERVEFYTIDKLAGDGESSSVSGFIKRWRNANPTKGYLDMFSDMRANGVDAKNIKSAKDQVLKSARNIGKDEVKKVNEAWASYNASAPKAERDESAGGIGGKNYATKEEADAAVAQMIFVDSFDSDMLTRHMDNAGGIDVTNIEEAAQYFTEKGIGVDALSDAMKKAKEAYIANTDDVDENIIAAFDKTIRKDANEDYSFWKGKHAEYKRNAILAATDESTISNAGQRIEYGVRQLGGKVKPEELYEIIKGTAELPWANKYSVKEALLDLGFTDTGEFNDPEKAGAWTEGWTEQDRILFRDMLKKNGYRSVYEIDAKQVDTPEWVEPTADEIEVLKDVKLGDEALIESMYKYVQSHGGWHAEDLNASLTSYYKSLGIPEYRVTSAKLGLDWRYLRGDYKESPSLGNTEDYLKSVISPDDTLAAGDYQISKDWMDEMVANGELTPFEAYNVLCGEGLQDEIMAFDEEGWHEAIYKEKIVPEMFNAADGTTKLYWESLSPEDQKAEADRLWDSMTDEQRTEMFADYDWRYDPSIYRTAGQAWSEQFIAAIPSVVTNMASGAVGMADAIASLVSGKEDLWQATEDINALNQRVASFGAVTDGVNGAQVAQIASDATAELIKMVALGKIGGSIADKVGGATGLTWMAENPMSTNGVQKMAGMAIDLLKASPFSAMATGNAFAEAKAAGASNAEALPYAFVVGSLEGIIESLNVDKVWGEVMGNGAFGKMLAEGGSLYSAASVVAKARLASIPVAFLGEATEEGLSYVAEALWKTAATQRGAQWAKDFQFSWKELGEQMLMGGITGALGATLGSPNITKESIMIDYYKNNGTVTAAAVDADTAKTWWQTFNEERKLTYRNGGSRIMGMTEFADTINTLQENYRTLHSVNENDPESIPNMQQSYEKLKANEDAKVNAIERELDGLRGKLKGLNPYDSEDAKEFAKVSTQIRNNEGALEDAKNKRDTALRASEAAIASKKAQAEEQYSNALLKLNSHFAGIYLRNEDAIKKMDHDTIANNMANARVNGDDVTPDSLTKEAEAEANETVAEAEQAAQSPEDVATKARELAYNRVYKDQEAGKAYAEGRRGEGDSKLTRVQFAENERQNFQAKTTAKLRRVTLELAGLEAADGMSAKEIFAEAKKSMTDEAAQKLELYQKLSKALGLNMVVRDVVAGTSGYVHDGKLYVTLNGKQSMLRVASHELTHYMAEHARGKYDVLRNHLINEVGGQEAFDQKVAEKAQEYGLDINTEGGRLEADDEVCAELCEKMLENKDALERFVQTDMDAAKTLKSRLAKTLVAVKSAIRSLGTSDSETKADLIKEQDTIESWYRGLSDAIDAANAEAKAKAKPTAETATETTATVEQPQAPPTAEANPDLYMGDEEARKEQLRSDLMKLAEKGTKVNGLKWQEVNDVLDRAVFGDKSNYNKADYAQVRSMLAQLIPEVTAYVNGDANVDVDALNERLSTAIDYMLSHYQESSDGTFDLAKVFPGKIALSDTAYNELRSHDMTLREASNRLRQALGGKFVSFVYKRSPEYRTATRIDQLWQEIGQLDPNYESEFSYGNVGEDALALIEYAERKSGDKSSFDELYGSQRADVVDAQVGEFLDAVQSMVEGKSAEQSGDAQHMLDGVNEDGRFIFRGNFPAGTTNRERGNRIVQLVQQVWSKEPISLTVWNDDGTTRKIKATFDPTLEKRSDLSKIAYGNRHGNASEKRITLDLADDLYFIAETSSYSRSKAATEKSENPSHDGVKQYHYFVNDLLYVPNEGGEPIPARMNIDVKERDDGDYFYTFHVDKMGKQERIARQTLHAAVDTENGGNDSYTDSKSQNDDTVNPSAEFSLDDDYMPLAEKYDAGIATDAEIAEMQRDVEEAADAAGFPDVQYDPVIYDANGDVVPLSERFSQDFAGNRYMVDDDRDELVKRYGAIDQGRNPRARDTQVPRRTNDNNRVSQWIRSLVESDKLTDDQAQNVLRMVVEQDYGTYVPTSQAERMQEAWEYIAGRQPLQAQQEFHDMVMQGKFGVKTNALGIQLLSDASARGDIESVLDIASDLQLAATEAGQSAQIFNVLKELKGVGSAWYMQKVIDRMNSKYADRIAAGKMQKIVVDSALMADLAKATTVDQIAKAEEAVAKDVARQLPLTWDDRLSSWRYFSMLANPTTHIRNITGNLLMKGLNAAKDVVATGIEKGLGIDQSQRAHAVLTSADRSAWGNFAQQSYEEQAKNLSGGGKLGFETFIKQNMRSFDTKWVNALAKFNFNALEGEDIAFIRPAYKTALMQYMKAQGYTLNNEGKAGKVGKDGTFTEMSKADMNAAIDWASNQAWKATFRDASSLATMLNKLSKENAVSRLLVEGVMPFKKTPINIAKRGLEYSPAGIIMGTTQLLTKVKQGKMSAASAIDNLASGITGTALMALGVFLAKAGVIRAGGEDKKKYETYLEDTGDQTYSFKFGDASVNMSSIAPATIPLFMGVALQEMIGRSGDSVDLSTITDVLAGTLNPFMEMSFMSSLNSALKNYNNDGIGGALGSTIMTAAQNYGSQYLPTLGGKVAQFIDPTVRSTKSDATSPVGGNLDYYARSLAKKVPGLEATLQPDVDVWGRTNTKDSFTDWALDFANKFILPTNVKISNRDAVDKELIRVVESTGNTDFLPSDGNKYFTVKGQKYTMNAKQYAQYSQERGQAAYAAIKDVMASSAYVTASDEDKANMLNKAKEAAYKAVNNIWKEKLGALD